MVCLERRKHSCSLKHRTLTMKNRDKRKGLERQENRKPKRNRTNWWKKPFTSNILMLLLLLSWNKSKETRQEKTAKKQERSQKETKEQGRTKKINKRKRERERETGNEKEKWRKPRRKKVRHWKMNNNNPFSGGKQCFCKQTNKKTKRKERLRANCPKTHVQGCVDPSWRRKRRKEQNIKGREGICKISPYKFTKTRSTKEDKRTPENSEKPSAPQPQADFWQRPESNQTATEV